MGWKSTLYLSRRDAINAIIGCLDKTPFDEMTNSELTDMMSNLGIGSNVDQPYYGCNFIVEDDDQTDKSFDSTYL